MSKDNDTKRPGRIGWVDLTVPDAREIRDFYSAVVGWTHSAVDMGEYSDFCMIPSDGEGPVAGICHARGMNKDLPPQWMIYITVPDLDTSVVECEQHGGKLVFGPLEMGGQSRYCVIQDPAGAYVALYEQG